MVGGPHDTTSVAELVRAEACGIGVLAGGFEQRSGCERVQEREVALAGAMHSRENSVDRPRSKSTHDQLREDANAEVPSRFTSSLQRARKLWTSRPRCRPGAGPGPFDGKRPLYRGINAARASQALRAGPVWNLLTATMASPMKSIRTASCATKNGGSVCVGASAFRAGNFRKACTTATKTLR